MRLNELRFRRGSADDALPLAEVAVEGWETYRSFAPPGWTPASLVEEHGRVLATLRQPSTWCEIAEAAPGAAGHAIVLAASDVGRVARRADFGCGSGAPGVWCEPCRRVNIATS